MKKPAKAAVPVEETPKKKPGRPPKDVASAASDTAGAKRGRKPKTPDKPKGDDTDLSDVEAEFAEEPAPTTEKVKP
ncbi:MAG: RNA polymerase sigma factor RpoD, partial [Rhodoferax sp.]